jgi:uncharacterized protein YndB with AHSA1/START domain
MSRRSVEHSTFVIERRYEALPERVYAAWATADAKAKWFGSSSEYDLDFRIGGKELNRGTGPDGTVYTYDALYQDIIPDERIVFTYSMLMGETRLSVSLTTVEFKKHGSATRLVYTEQGSFLDRHEDPRQRERGTAGLLEALGKQLDVVVSQQ